MAETVTVYGDNRTSTKVIDSLLDIHSNKTHVVRTLQVAVDASPSDTTMFTVPAGKTFLLSRVQGGKSTANVYGVKLYDASGDAVNASTDKVILRAALPGETDAVSPFDWTFTTPVLIENGISFDSANVPSSCTVYLQIEGYIIG